LREITSNFCVPRLENSFAWRPCVVAFALTGSGVLVALRCVLGAALGGGWVGEVCGIRARRVWRTHRGLRRGRRGRRGRLWSGGRWMSGVVVGAAAGGSGRQGGRGGSVVGVRLPRRPRRPLRPPLLLLLLLHPPRLRLLPPRTKNNKNNSSIRNSGISIRSRSCGCRRTTKSWP